MNLRIGIVGLPNAGKSTLFNALLKRQVAFVANYPFATIEPNIGVVPVPDSRLPELARVVEKEDGVKPPIVPAIVEFVDIAGLVKGASEGQGLGNKFLSHIREVHCICHLIRFFPDPNIVHIAGAVDPGRDKEIVETELILADLQTLAKQEESKIIRKLIDGLNSGRLARDIITDPEERHEVRELQLLTMKPMLYVANVSEQQLSDSTFTLVTMKQYNNPLCICAETESQLSGLSETEQTEYLKSLGLTSSGLDRVIQKAYDMLGLISFLTCGTIEARAWTIENGTKAPQAAGVIHTDFEKKFIKCDAADFVGFVAAGGWKKARELGKVRSEGKEYVMKDGDVVEFKVGT